MADGQGGTETSLDFKRFSEDFSKKLDDISNGFNTLSSKVDEKTTSIENKVEAFQKREREDDNREQLTDYDLEEKKKIERVVKQEISAHKEDIARQQAYERKCATWDKKAYEDFPLIKDPVVAKQVQDLIRTNMEPIGKDVDGNVVYSPDAVYNAAAIIVAKLGQEGKLSDFPEPEQMDIGGYGKRIKGKEVNEIQLDIAQRLGIKPERAREIYKGYVPGIRRQST